MTRAQIITKIIEASYFADDPIWRSDYANYGEVTAQDVYDFEHGEFEGFADAALARLEAEGLLDFDPERDAERVTRLVCEVSCAGWGVACWSLAGAA